MPDKPPDVKKTWKELLIDRASEVMKHGEGEIRFKVFKRSKEQATEFIIEGGPVIRGKDEKC